MLKTSLKWSSTCQRSENTLFVSNHIFSIVCSDKRLHFALTEAAIDLTQSDDDDEMVESTSGKLPALTDLSYQRGWLFTVSLSGACSPVRKTGEEQDVHMAAVEGETCSSITPVPAHDIVLYLQLSKLLKRFLARNL